MTEKELLAARQSIVQKLTQARLEKGLSQEQLAKRIGTQRSNICRIEKGTQNLSLDLMLKIAEALDKDVSVMLEERSSTMEKVYSLRLYDETLLTFTLEERGLEGLQATILHTETAKVDVKRPFRQEEELKAKTDRLNELNVLLHMDKRENEIVGGEPDEGEELPEKKPRDLER